MRTVKSGCACLTLALAGWVTAAGAVNTSWLGGDGVWTNGTRWSEGAVPAGGDVVMVTNDGPDDVTVTYRNPDNPNLGYLGLERTSGGMLVITQSQDNLTVTGSVRIGMSPGSSVRFVQNGGTNIFGVNWPYTFSLGHTAGATAVYHMVSGCLGANGNIGGYAANTQIGSGGTGLFIQEDGLHHGATTFSAADAANKELVLGGMRTPQQAYNYGRTVGGDGTYRLNGGILRYRNAYVGCLDSSQGTFIQTGGSNLFENIYIGRFGVGSFHFDGGFFVNSTVYIGGYGGTGVLTQTGGVIGGNKVYCRLHVGSGATNSAGFAGQGVFNMFGGTYKPYYSEFRIGVDGYGILNQTNGTLMLTDHSGIEKYTVSIGYTNGAYGTFQLSGGEFRARTLAVGNLGDATGEVCQTGGTLAVGGASLGGLVIGGNESAVGVYRFGDADATGLITNTADFTTGNDLTVRLTAGASGTFRGWGEVHLNDTLINNGCVIADGYGTDRTLSLERFVRVSNTVENAAGETNGWYAQRGGKLTLPGVTVAVGDGSYTWGESAGDAEPDLVNSLRFTFTGVTGGGVLTNSLLAADRAELPPLPEGFKAAGVWQVRKPAGLGYGTLEVTFRYDDARREALGLKDVTLLQTTGGAWLSVPGSMNSAASLYSAAAVVLGTDTYFALGRGPYGTLIRVQ